MSVKLRKLHRKIKKLSKLKGRTNFFEDEYRLSGQLVIDK